MRGRGYAIGAVGALVAAFAALAVFFIDFGSVARSTASRWAAMATSLAFWFVVLLAGLAASARRRRYAVIGRWVALPLLVVLMFQFDILGVFFVPAFGLMLAAVFAAHGDRGSDRPSASDCTRPTDRTSRQGQVGPRPGERVHERAGNGCQRTDT